MYSIGKFDNSTGEKTGETLIGIHSGGDNPSAFKHVERGTVFLPKWYARVSYYVFNLVNLTCDKYLSKGWIDLSEVNEHHYVGTQAYSALGQIIVSILFRLPALLSG